jgi:two-component system nitrogen regulation response regulator NtrX
MARILIIEDEESIRRVLSKILVQSDPDHEIIEARDGLEGIRMINEDDTIDLIFCDIKMPKKDGTEVLQSIGDRTDELPVIMISGHGDLDTAVECMRLGAFDYLPKPPDLNRLLTTAKNGLERKKIKAENKRLKKRLVKLDQMIGDSTALNTIRSMIGKVADTTARVLITGPNGSGKELVARALHQHGSRSSSSFVEVNCAAIPSELIESELFGHVKGAFTSAHKDRVGKFEIAHGGTLFLDEIGDMSLSAQAKVLRALQESQIVRVGAEKSIKVDVRVVAATNKNLRNEIDEGRFREDLYHRLSVILIEVPALDTRKEDIPQLIDYFSHQIAEQMGIAKKPIAKDALKALVSRSYPGNIRELRNIIERLMILSEDKITLELVRSFAL